jgi:CO/xanthine dehydrogenase Mo-binding subunit
MDAAKAVKVDYEVLPFVPDERTELDPKSPAVVGSNNGSQRRIIANSPVSKEHFPRLARAA